MAVSKPTAGRLAALVRMLNGTDAKSVTSSELEQLTGWSSATIRKDISALDAAAELEAAGGTGYDVQTLRRIIMERLGLSVEKKCCIVGLGRLGSSFLDYNGLEKTPFILAAGFDSNVNRLEILDADVPLLPTFKIADVIPRLGIEYALLCVPPDHAQAAADKLVAAGIKGIVNYAPVHLVVPEGIEIENVCVADALCSLTARISASN